MHPLSCRGHHTSDLRTRSVVASSHSNLLALKLDALQGHAKASVPCCSHREGASSGVGPQAHLTLTHVCLLQVCMGLGVMGLLLAGLLSCPGWLYLASRLGKYKTWLIQNFIGAATFLLFFLPRGEPFYCSGVSA